MFKATNSFFTFEEIFILGPEREIWQLEKTFWDCKQFVNARIVTLAHTLTLKLLFNFYFCGSTEFSDKASHITIVYSVLTKN